MNAKEYYCYGFLEKYGYNINGKITKKQFDNCFRREKLYDAANVEIYPENTSQADSVFLIKNPGEKYKVLSTGERGSGITMEFEELGCALNYMLCLLRFKKDKKDKF